MDTVLDLPQREHQNSASRSSPLVFSTLTAEHLAASYVEQPHPTPSSVLTHISDLSSPLHVTAAEGTLIALFQPEQLHAILTESIEESLNLGAAKIELLQPGQTRIQGNPVPTMPASSKLPEWELAVVFTSDDPFLTSTKRQKIFYISIGISIISSIAILIFLVARHLNAQMRLAQMKNELVSTVSHELKTPLASMRALVETLLAGRYRTQEQQTEYLELIAKENNRLSHLIDNFLTFSRLDKGRHHFRFQSLAPKTLAEQAIEALHERLNASDCHFTRELVEPLPQIEADPDAITTVLVNLLDNALKYSNEPRLIQLQVHADGDFVVFTIKDNGIGFSNAERKQIFGQFHQIDQGLTRERGGCGLGLSIVSSIIQGHHGRIEVESEPGQGSCFRAFLPIAKTESQSV
jgi:signal transduction histidine kinase